VRRLALALVVAFVVLGAGAGVAHARDPGGPVGMTKNLALHLQIGGVTNEVLADSQRPTQYESSGSANFFRIRGGGYLDMTHTGHLIAVEATMGFGWIDKGAFTLPAVEMDMQPEQVLQPTWGRLFLDFDLTMLVDVIHLQDNRWVPPSKLAFIGGFGMSTDFAYFYLGGRLAGKLGGLQGELEYQRRFGESFSAPNMREERIHAYVYYKNFGLGIETWHGYSEDERGFAATDRVFRGGYGMTTFNLMWAR
jgi:hypothetical protein